MKISEGIDRQTMRGRRRKTTHSLSSLMGEQLVQHFMVDLTPPIKSLIQPPKAAPHTKFNPQNLRVFFLFHQHESCLPSSSCATPSLPSSYCLSWRFTTSWPRTTWSATTTGGTPAPTTSPGPRSTTSPSATFSVCSIHRRRTCVCGRTSDDHYSFFVM